MSLRVGHIRYLNCVPFFHHLRECGFEGEIVRGVPAELNRQLAKGEIDLSPSSSWEYAVGWKDYLLLPGHSISSRGPVHSVLLFSPYPPQALSGKTVALTGESATSIHLLQVLLQRFYGAEGVRYQVPGCPVEDLLASGEPALLIGDRALRARKLWPAAPFYDLGSMWREQVGLPFVFALWIVRREVAAERGAELSRFLRQLGAARQQAAEHYAAIAATLGGEQILPAPELVDYWRQVSYDLTPDHFAGLRRFWAESHAMGLLRDMPEVEFFEPSA